MRECMENVWYGWNGGECPVHPNSVVEAVWTACGGAVRSEQREARNFAWGVNASKIIAFRVVKEYREPREWWLAKSVTYTHAYEDLEGAQRYERYNNDVEIIHVREVVEGGAA